MQYGSTERSGQSGRSHSPTTQGVLGLARIAKCACCSYLISVYEARFFEVVGHLLEQVDEHSSAPTFQTLDDTEVYCDAVLCGLVAELTLIAHMGRETDINGRMRVGVNRAGWQAGVAQ